MNSNKNILPIISNLYPSMHKTEKKIAGLILEDPNNVINMTVAEIAKELEIAQSSIIRFCKTIGLSGFSELKINLAQNIAKPQDIIYKDIKLGDGIDSITAKIFSSYAQTLKESLEFIDIKQLEFAVNAIFSAKRVEFYGVGTSSNLAQDIYYRLMRIGIPAYAVVDPHIVRISASMLDEDCVAMGISYTGRSKDTVEALKIAQSKGAKTICLTSFLKSDITKYSDINLTIPTQETKIVQLEAMSSRIIHTAILDIIYTYVAVKRFKNTARHIENMNEILSTVRL